MWSLFLLRHLQLVVCGKVVSFRMDIKTDTSDDGIALCAHNIGTVLCLILNMIGKAYMMVQRETERLFRLFYSYFL